MSSALEFISPSRLPAAKAKDDFLPASEILIQALAKSKVKVDTFPAAIKLQKMDLEKHTKSLSMLFALYHIAKYAEEHVQFVKRLSRTSRFDESIFSSLLESLHLVQNFDIVDKREAEKSL